MDAWNEFIYAAVPSGSDTNTAPAGIFGSLAGEETRWGPFTATGVSTALARWTADWVIVGPNDGGFLPRALPGRSSAWNSPTMPQRLRLLVTLVACFVVPAGHAEGLPRPSGPVVLTVTGAIDVTNAPGRAEFDREMLEGLGTIELRTSTYWTAGTPVFSGVLGRTLLRAVGARGTRAECRALNDYVVTIPLADFEQYDVVLALKMNGRYMRIRDKGPIWVVYPWDGHSELDDEQTKQKAIWQLVTMRIH